MCVWVDGCGYVGVDICVSVDVCVGVCMCVLSFHSVYQ